eukprot:m51a1_g12954 hypothetical protein (393) ;mRNA; r:174-3104
MQSAASLLLWAGVLSTPLGGLVGQTLSPAPDYGLQAAVASLLLVAVHRVLSWVAGPEDVDVDPVTELLGYSGALLAMLYVSSGLHCRHLEHWMLAQLFMWALLAAALCVGDLRGSETPMRSRVMAAIVGYSLVKVFDAAFFGGIWMLCVAALVEVLWLGCLCVWWSPTQLSSFDLPFQKQKQLLQVVHLCAVPVAALCLWASVVAVRWDLVDMAAVPSVSNATVQFDGPRVEHVVLHFGQAVPQPRSHWGGWRHGVTALVEVLDPLGAPLRAPLVLNYTMLATGPSCNTFTHFDTVKLSWPRGTNASDALLHPGAGGAVVLALTDLKGNMPVVTLALNTTKAIEGLARVLASDHGSEAVLQDLGIEHGQARQCQSPASVLWRPSADNPSLSP